MTPLPSAWLHHATDAHRRLLDVLDTLTEHDLRSPSLLPGWTIGHVLTHLARNADSHRGMVEAAARGEVADQYPGGREQRQADIEAGAGRPFAAIVADLARADAALEAAWRSVPDDGWDRVGRSVSGSEHTLADLVFRRWREVEVHLADLGTDSYLPADWPDDYVAEELTRALANLQDRAEPRALLQWLLGRADAPDLTPW